VNRVPGYRISIPNADGIAVTVVNRKKVDFIAHLFDSRRHGNLFGYRNQSKSYADGFPRDICCPFQFFARYPAACPFMIEVS
jgi:hypothetical protein